MTDKENHKVDPEIASLAIDWRALEQEVGELGNKLADLRGQGQAVVETRIRDLQKRHDEISKQLMDLKEKTYDQLLDNGASKDRGDAQGDVNANVGNALDAAKARADELGDRVTDAASSANAAVRSRVADIGEAAQEHREATAEKVADITEKIGATTKDIAANLLAKWNSLRGDIEKTFSQFRASSDQEIVRVNRDTAKRDPEREFTTPEDIKRNVGLTKAEKMTALENWAFRVQQRLDAASEGMLPEQAANAPSNDAELLRKIELILEEVKKAE